MFEHYTTIQLLLEDLCCSIAISKAALFTNDKRSLADSEQRRR